MSEAVQVPLEQTWWRQLPARLKHACPTAPPIHTLFLGSSGYGPGHYLAIAQAGFLGKRPDRVIYTHFPGNDIVEAEQALSDDQLRPFIHIEGDKASADSAFRKLPEYRHKTRRYGQLWLWALKHLRLLQAAVEVYHRLVLIPAIAADHTFKLEPQVDGRAFFPPRDPHWASAWSNTFAAIEGVREQARRIGAGFTLISLSTGLQVTPDEKRRKRALKAAGLPHLFYQENALLAFSREQGIDYLALAPAMAEQALKTKIDYHGFPNTLPGVGHWNAAGHRLAAELIAKHLCAQLPR